MELWQEIPLHALVRGDIHVILDAREASAAAIVEQRCYQALQQIRDILDDDRLDDPA